MAHIRVTIDGRTIMDADPRYIGKPPPELTPDKLRNSGTKLNPSQIALATVFSMYAMQGQIAGMTNFNFDDQNWQLTVRQIDGARHIDITTS